MKRLTEFQATCESNLVAALAACGFALKNRSIQGKTETYVVSEIPHAGLKLWIYEGEAMFTVSGKSYIYEAPDYPDPDDRISRFTAAVVAGAQGLRPTDSGSARISVFRGKKL